ncbi:MAG: 7-cyano-7-deazaguanine synthase, partial [Kiritimatiellae bacterium]|nr:7-cyano-7-deazaguanine synthase [Kiritimatiellia bacterium]
WDCTVDFVGRINHVLGLNRGMAVKVHAPFVNKSKADVITLGREMGVNYDHTWSCYRGGDEPCGTCPSCVERGGAGIKGQ